MSVSAILWISALVCFASSVTGETRLVPQDVSTHKEVVCSSTDVRNDADYFVEKLQNCTVIEGSLQILLIEHSDPSEYEGLSFPKLVEITDYLLLYRVYGLRTLANLFPNLSVIRGQRLFFNYALVVFEMPDFESLGLSSLTSIVRGAVRIEKNSALCYINTINWQLITQVKQEDHFIIENKDNKVGECVNLCPRGNGELPVCPTMEVQYNNGQRYTQQLCWNIDHCQKQCPGECGRRPCYAHWTGRKNESRCCHEECLGGCTGPRASNCIVCLHVMHQGQCQQRCPVGTYEFMKRRCLTEEECRNLTGGLWKVLDSGHCVSECPSGYMETKDDKHLCQKCEGPCPKICRTISIDNVAAAQYLKGCTVIEGSLEIQIRGGSHVGRELELNLGSLEEITEYLLIKRTSDLTSLSFLRSLRLISGQHLYNNRYAMIVFDNQNLQDIWDFKTHPNLTISHGRLFFHYNRKLCQHKIEELVRHVGLENVTDEKDIAKDTNGDKITCETFPIQLFVVKTDSTFAILRWTNFHATDSREILSWVINYRNANDGENVTMFGARDACGMDEWQTMDVRPDVDEEAEYVACFIHNLKPFTRYALYVQTYTIATASKGAISEIIYFTTDAESPTPPREIKVIATDKNELTVSWKPPSNPNGNVTHYMVYWQPQMLKVEDFDRRDYCIDKLQLHGRQRDWEKEEEEKKANKTTPVDGQCCACPKSQEEIRIEEEERAFQIEFENFLHDSVYVKSNWHDPEPEDEQDSADYDNIGHQGSSSSPSPAAPSRKRRATSNLPIDLAKFNETYRDSLMKLNITYVPSFEEDDEGELGMPYESAIVHYDHQIKLTNLRHFQEYNIEVIACHDYSSQADIKRCSNRAITMARTLPSATADSLHEANITVRNHSEVGEAFFSWSDPPAPNGLVLTYELQLTNLDVPDFKPQILCIPHKKFRVNHGYTKSDLAAGNWTYRIRAMSLAGNGSYTNYLYFYIPKVLTEPSRQTALIASITTLGVVILLLIAGLFTYHMAKKRIDPPIPEGTLVASINPEYWSESMVYIPDEWEVPRDKIKLIRELGKGSFGMVYEGIAYDLVDGQAEVKVAVKTVNENDSIRDRIEFLNEASVMKAFKCNHVVGLLGVVSQGQPTLVIMELMAEGDLKTYLRSHRPDCEENLGRVPPTLRQILQMAGEIADGMAYLAANKFVHRDLAARNCMVSESLVVKIGDFGMTRDIYETDYYRKGGKGLLPVRWMAPESLRDGTFTSKSDVWSYGVVIWEMATLAAQPYPGLSNEEVLHYVTDGRILDKPEGCPDRLYQLMLWCWRSNIRQRPTFCEIIEMLEPELNDSFREESYYFSAENQPQQDEGLTGTPTTATDPEEGERTPLTHGLDSGRPPLGEDSVPEGLEGEMYPLKPQRLREEEEDSHSSLSSCYHSQQPSPKHRSPEGRSPNCSRKSSSSSSTGSSDAIHKSNNHNWKGLGSHNSSLKARGGGPNGIKANGGSGDQWSPAWSSANNSAIQSSDGSTDSASARANGVLNGHIPKGYISPPRC